MTRADKDRIEDILRGIARLREVWRLGRPAFDGDWMVRSAACYELIVMGEAFNNLSDEFVESYSTLPVREAVGLRNVLAHEYWRTDDDILWNTISIDIPNLTEMIEI